MHDSNCSCGGSFQSAQKPWNRDGPSVCSCDSIHRHNGSNGVRRFTRTRGFLSANSVIGATPYAQHYWHHWVFFPIPIYFIAYWILLVWCRIPCWNRVAFPQFSSFVRTFGFVKVPSSIGRGEFSFAPCDQRCRKRWKFIPCSTWAIRGRSTLNSTIWISAWNGAKVNITYFKLLRVDKSLRRRWTDKQ